MKEKPTITIKEIASKLNRSQRAIELSIHKMTIMGELKREGPDKGGYWVILFGN